MRNPPILTMLLSDILVSDGATGTELQKRGLVAGMCPEEFNITHPEIVEGIHRAYLAAGAEILTTNSFGGNRIRLKHYGFESRVRELNKRSAEIARSVAGDRAYIAGSMGPTGEILVPLGQTSKAEVRDAFREQARTLAEGGVDFILIETMMAIEEAEAAVDAAKNSTGLTVAATMSFEVGPRGIRTMWGVDIPTAVQRLTDAGADIFGSNCGRGFDEMVQIVREMRPLTTKPIIAQPNAGMPQWINGEAVYPESAETIRPKVESLLRLGANIVGGCCGTTPDHIRSIRETLDDFRSHRT